MIGPSRQRAGKHKTTFLPDVKTSDHDLLVNDLFALFPHTGGEKGYLGHLRVEKIQLGRPSRWGFLTHKSPSTTPENLITVAVTRGLFQDCDLPYSACFLNSTSLDLASHGAYKTMPSVLRSSCKHPRIVGWNPGRFCWAETRKTSVEW